MTCDDLGRAGCSDCAVQHYRSAGRDAEYLMGELFDHQDRKAALSERSDLLVQLGDDSWGEAH